MSVPIFGTFGAPPAPPKPPELDRTATDAVQSIIQTSTDYAGAAQNSAIRAIDALGKFQPSLPAVSSAPINLPSVSLPQLGFAPVEPTGINASFPNAPSELALGTVPNVDLGSMPTYDVGSPMLIDIPLPDPLSALLPSSPTLAVVPIPVEPSFVLPAVPTFIGLNLPAVPTLDLPTFTDTLVDAPSAPNASFTYSEVAYASANLSALNNRLVGIINGGTTGLSPQVEDALWQRGRDREAQVSQRAIEEAQRMFAARGFSMPSGTLLRVVQQAIQDSLGRDAALSREIMIKQGELEQSNFQFSFNAAINLESQLMDQFNQVQARALDAAKFTFQAVLQIFNAQVQLFQANVQAFQAKASVFETRLRGALAQLEVYKSQLEGQKLIGDLNTQQVQQYSAQIDAVKALSDVYKTRVDAAKAQIDAQRAQVEIYTAQLTGYDSQVKSKATEYQAYATRVQAELTKTEIFSQQVGAYKSRVDAYGVLVNAKLSQQTMDFRRLQEYPLEVYKSRVQAYQTSVAAEAQRVQSLISVFDQRVRAYGTVEGAKTANSGLQVEYAKALAGVSVSAAQIAVSTSSANLAAATAASETVQASLRAAAQVSSQLASAALSSRSVHASLSDSTSNSTGFSVSNGVNYGINNSYGANNSGNTSEVTTIKGD